MKEKTLNKVVDEIAKAEKPCIVMPKDATIIDGNSRLDAIIRELGARGGVPFSPSH